MLILLSTLFILFSAAMTKLFSAAALDTRLMDKPNERSMHSKPVVRGGGVVFIGLTLFYFVFICYYSGAPLTGQLVWILSVALLAGVSFFDDLYQLSAKSRFLVQCVVATLVAVFMLPERLDLGLVILNNAFFMVPFLFFSVIWAINHFNFMDGIDGFCALQAVFICVAYALLFSFNDAIIYQSLCLVLIFNLSGFLFFNFPPAKLFMGDVGSASLGLITFCIALIAQQKYQISLLYWFVLNSLFLFDATVTLFRRVMNKEKWSAAHKKHAYQRLRQFGINTRVILLGQFAINASILTVILLFNADKISLTVLLFFVLSLLSGVYMLIERVFPMYPIPGDVKA